MQARNAVLNFVLAIMVQVLTLSTASRARALTQKDIDDCVSGPSADQQIASCAAAIQSGQWSGKSLAWAYLNRGDGYFKKNDYARATADYGQGIQLDPTNSMAYFKRGSAFFKKSELDDVLAEGGLPGEGGALDKAFADLNRAIDLNPLFAAAYRARALCHKAKRDAGSAMADLNQAIKLDPKDGSSYYNRGVIFMNKGDSNRAMADYSQAISLDPTNALAFLFRADIHVQRGELDLGIADYSAALGNDPKMVAAYGRRGMALLAKGDPDRAIADLSKAVELLPIYGEAYKSRGDALRMKGQLPEAAGDYQRAIANDRDYNEYNTGLLPLVREICRKPASDDLRRICEEENPKIVAKVKEICSRLQADEQAKCFAVASATDPPLNESQKPPPPGPDRAQSDQAKLVKMAPYRLRGALGSQSCCFAVQVVDASGAAVSHAKVAWEMPGLGDDAYVTETDNQGIARASNLYAFSAAYESKQRVRLIAKDAGAGWRKSAELASAPGVDPVEFDYEQY